MQRLTIAAALSCALSSAPALAAPQTYFLFGVASSGFDATATAGCTVAGDDSGTGGTLGVGYGFSDHLALEFGFMSLGSYDTTMTCPGPTTFAVTVPERGLQLSGLLRLPFGESGEARGFAAFGRLGAYSWSENAQSGTEPMVGLGLEWRVSRYQSLRLEYTDMGDELDAVQLSLRWDY